MNWQATRKLTADDGRSVEVSIGTPELTSDPPVPDWKCPVRFVIDGASDIRHATGGDAFQALQLALDLIYLSVREMGCTLDGFPAKETGFFRMIIQENHAFFDLDRLHSVIDEETKRLLTEGNARAEAKMQERQAAKKLSEPKPHNPDDVK